MKRTLLVAINIIFCISIMRGQKTEESEQTPVVKLSENVNVRFGGFVRFDYFIDSRRTVGVVDDLFGFFPQNNVYDENGNDQNQVVRQYLSAQATRFNALFTGPDVMKAALSSYFEFDFTGGNSVNVRLRHAYLKLNWTKSEILIGKTWNPLTNTVLPSVIGLHTGIPFQPFARGDQFRYSYYAGKFTFLTAAFYQTEHRSFSYTNTLLQEVGQPTDNVLSNPIPEMHVQIQYKSGALFTGVVSEYKMIKPSTTTHGTAGAFSSSETVSSYSFGGFAEYKKDKLMIKGSAIYAQNLSEMFQQGGYAVTSLDQATGARTYTPSNSFSAWMAFSYGTKIVTGIFGGYQKNLGFGENILSGPGTFLGRWQNIDHIYRIAPSLKYVSGRIILGAELDFNVVAYGTVDHHNKGKVFNSKEIHGVRGLLMGTFLF